MMQANEVRRNNWVLFDDRYFKIDVISEEFPTLDTMEFGLGVVNWNNIHPIPLTEEILLKCGDIKWLLSDRGGYYVLINNKKIRIKFVHSIQNIYLCIEQKELNLCL